MISELKYYNKLSFITQYIFIKLADNAFLSVAYILYGIKVVYL